MAACTFVGLHPDEAVLRGGCLKKPHILTGLTEVGDKTFVALRARSWTLRSYLLPSGKINNRAVSTALRAMSTSRQEVTDALLADLASTKIIHDLPASASPTKVLDKTDMLRLDDGTPTESPSKMPRRAGNTSATRLRAQLPHSIVLSLIICGAPWTPEVIVERTSGRGGFPKPVRMECTTENMRRLREACVSALGAAASSEGICTMKPVAKRKPRGSLKSASGAEYWHGSRSKWVVKTLVSLPGAKKAKYRWLTRQPSDQAQPAALREVHEPGATAPLLPTTSEAVESQDGVDGDGL